MGQKEIIEVLENEFNIDPNKRFKREELLKKLGKENNYKNDYLNKVLRRLRENDEVDYIIDESSPLGTKQFLYRYKEFNSKIVVFKK